MQSSYASCILLLLALFTATNAIPSRIRPEVVTSLGEIHGRRLIDRGDRIVDGFYAIPYAKAPVGELRFKKPTAHEPWTVPLNATKFGPRCAQNLAVELYAGGSVKSEDCLLLNVFAPAWESDHTFPVMFWIHGGAFSFGSSVEYGDIGIADHLVAKGVIVVTINYRLGPFGFFTTGDDESPGNYGLWDQTLALRWVKEHIGAFNGDPNKITVFGESAGGASTDWLTLSPYSRDLFDQAITMSGTVSAPWALVDTKSLSTELAAQLKCPLTSSQSIVECMRAKSTDEINAAVEATGGALTQDLTLLKYSPVIDGDFLPRDPTQLRKEAPKKRVIAGTTELESGLWTMQISPEMSNEIRLKYHTRPDFGVADLKKFIEELVPKDKYRNFELLRVLATHEYLRDGNPNNHTFIIEKYTEAHSDYVFNIPLYNDVQSMVANDWIVHLYSFDYANPEAFMDDNPLKKAYHFMEAPYLFDVTNLKPFQFNRDDAKVLKRFTRMFTNFAKYGNPNTNKDGKKSDIWKPVTKENRDQYLSISAHSKFQEGFHRSSIAFWTSLVPDIEHFEQYHQPKATTTTKKSEL